MWQRRGQLGEFRQGGVQRLKISEQIADQAVGEVASQIRKARDKFPEVELIVVERIHQLAHGLDALAQLFSILAEPRGGHIAGGQSGIHSLARKFAAAQGQKDSRRKYGIEKSESVSGKNQSIGGAIARAIGILAGHPVRPGLPAGREMLLNPAIVLYFSLKDRGEVARVSIQVILLGDDAHADKIFGKR